MTLTTGTTWDLVLSAPTRRSTRAGGCGMSPRALYQELLYDRVRVVDLRTSAERSAGVLHPDFPLDVVHPAELVAHLVNTPALQPVVLLSQDGTAAAAAADQLRTLGLAQVGYADGGYRAWAEAGLPVLGHTG
ncbi:rhodanese-like domain-containing protein [Ruania zhangjianzhongii]|uniref:rhodanese-like domain-containing protein n=1 Tax=Ruania zhangjianzhongii TaxID=2603206 RepID=UPI0011CAA0A6|nr:rhodanese-like domain-containing protein [Ruania zhangjianzhongii]